MYYVKSKTNGTTCDRMYNVTSKTNGTNDKGPKNLIWFGAVHGALAEE